MSMWWIDITVYSAVHMCVNVQMYGWPSRRVNEEACYQLYDMIVETEAGC